MLPKIIEFTDLFPPLERGKWGGLVAGAMGVATVIGPILGGYLTDYFSWRWCFFVTIPLAVIIIILFIFLFPKIRSSDVKRKVDYFGAVMIIVVIVPLMLALTWGGVNYAWNSLIVIGLFVFSVVMFIVFLINENRNDDPIIPIKLYKNRVVAVSSMVPGRRPDASVAVD